MLVKDCRHPIGLGRIMHIISSREIVELVSSSLHGDCEKSWMI